MKNILKFGFLLAAAIMFSSVFVACNDEEELGEAPRLFRPVTEGESGGQWIKLTWDYLSMSEYYQVELSRDSFLTIDSTILALTSPLTIETGILWDTEYQIRIKAFGDGIESDYYVCENVVVPDYPTLLQDIPSSDIIDNAVIVRWINDDVVPFTALEFVDADNTVIKTVPLSEADLTNGAVEVSGFDPASDYMVKIYSGEVYRGKKKFATKAAQEFVNPVDLRELSDDLAGAALSQTLLDTIADNSTVILKGGQSYVLSSTLKVGKSVKFVTGYSFTGKAKLVMGTSTSGGNFSVADGATVPNIAFENIDFVTGADKLTSNYGGRYVFNINPATAAIVSEMISFENCSMRYLRGVLRAQTNITIEHVIVNNCVLDSIGGYGIINGDNANSTVKNMTLTNSTVLHADKVLVNSKSDTPGNIKVNNVTFCWTPFGPGNYFLDFGAKVVSGEVSFTNNIIGPVNVTSSAQTANGFRSSTSVITASGNYHTSEFSWTMKADLVTPNAPIESTAYGKASTELWTNPATYDFTFMDAKFEGRTTAGDPRWWR